MPKIYLHTLLILLLITSTSGKNDDSNTFNGVWSGCLNGNYVEIHFLSEYEVLVLNNQNEDSIEIMNYTFINDAFLISPVFEDDTIVKRFMEGTYEAIIKYQFDNFLIRNDSVQFKYLNRDYTMSLDHENEFYKKRKLRKGQFERIWKNYNSNTNQMHCSSN